MNGQFLRTERDADLAVWWLDHQDAQHNTLSTGALREIGTALDETAGDPGIRGVVIASAKPDSFIVGADLREIQAFQTRQEAEALSRQAHTLIGRVRALGKPTVAAIHGPAMGGGLELALACSMRIASNHDATRFALPEVKLGLVPGGGGTQLLPRLVGIQQSLPLLLTGKNTYPRPARRMGLVDVLSHRPGLLPAAKAAARALAAGERDANGGGPHAVHERLLESNPLTRRLIYSRALEKTKERTRGNYPAPLRIIECVRTGMEEGLEEGLELEAAVFAHLSRTSESQELVRLFFARNDAERNPYPVAKPPVRRVGVLGAGLMGSGIAEVTASNGMDVYVKDRSLDLAADARKHVYRSASKKVRKGALRRFDRDMLVERVIPTAEYDAFSRVDLVIEAAPEEVALKRRLIEDVEEHADSKCIFASNTSSIPISSLAEASSRPELVIGMHYFSPVSKIPLLEVVRTQRNPDWVIGTAIDVGIRQGKTVIVVHDGPGFYTTRVLTLYMNEALNLLEDGARIERVDEAMRDFGFPMGPYELFDLVGVDVASKIAEVLSDSFVERGIQPNMAAKALVEAGMKGQKSGAGFYRYDDGKKEDVHEAAYEHFHGARTAVPTEQAQNRLVMAFVNESANCLEDGILRSAVDGDVGAVFGLGFPPFLGGPFRYVDRLRPGFIVGQLEGLQAEHGFQFSPSPAIRRLAREGRTFY